MSEVIRAYHFNTGKCGYGDNRPIIEGETLSVACKPECCERGLHGSVDIMDALSYAPSDATHISIVEIWGDIDRQDDKICGTHRKCIKQIECERILHEFALWCAEQVRHLMTDERSTHALDVKRRWLDGQATDEELAATTAAADDAAHGALRILSMTEVWAARQVRAARAAWAAAYAASWAAARDLASNATRNKQRAKLLEMLGVTE